MGIEEGWSMNKKSENLLCMFTRDKWISVMVSFIFQLLLWDDSCSHFL